MQIKRLIVGDLETNCFLLASGSEGGVIDPGGDAEKILKEIKELKEKVFQLEETIFQLKVRINDLNLIIINKQDFLHSVDDLRDIELTIGGFTQILNENEKLKNEVISCNVNYQ